MCLNTSKFPQPEIASISFFLVMAFRILKNVILKNVRCSTFVLMFPIFCRKNVHIIKYFPKPLRYRFESFLNKTSIIPMIVFSYLNLKIITTLISSYSFFEPDLREIKPFDLQG